MDFKEIDFFSDLHEIYGFSKDSPVGWNQNEQISVILASDFKGAIPFSAFLSKKITIFIK